MKKTLKIVGIIISIVSALLIVLPFAFQGKITELVKNYINANLNAKVAFADVNLSFIRQFPDAHVEITDLIITNFEPFKDETFTTAKEISFNLGIKELFKTASDEPIVINAIYIDEALLTLKTDKFGNNNYDITKASETTKTKSTDTGFAFDIKDYQIKNSALTYLDEGANILLQLTEFNHEGHGAFTASTSILDTKSEANISFSFDSISYLSSNPVKLDALFELDLSNSKYTFKENTGYINELPLHFEGYIQQLENGQDIDIVFENPESDFKNFLAVIPKEYSKNIENVETTGAFKVKGKIKGLSTEDLIPTLDIRVISDNASFKYPDLPKAVRDITIHTFIKNTTGNPDDTYIDIETLDFKIDEDVFKSEITVKNVTKNPQINLNLDGVLNLANISQAYPIDEEHNLSGILKANLRAFFDMNSIEKNAYQNIKSDGSASFSHLVLENESFNNPFEISEADFTFNTNNITLNNFSAKTGISDFKVTGTINNLLGFMLKDQSLKGNFILQSNVLNVNDLMSQEALEASENKETTVIESAKISAFLDCTISVTSNTVIYDNLNLKQVAGVLTIRDQKAKLSNLKSNLFDGSLAVSGEVSTQEAIPTFNMNLIIDGFDIAQSFDDLELFQNLAPIAKLLQGKLNTNLNLSGTLDESLSPNLNSVSGDALAQVLATSFDTAQNSLLNNLEGALSFIDFDAIEINDLQTSLEFADGKVAVKPFDVTYKDITIEVSGAHGFDKTIDYNAVLDVPAKYLGSDINRLIGKIDDSEVNNITIPVTANISGFFTQPKVETDLSSGVKDLSNQLIEIQKQKLLNEGTQKVNDLIGDMIGSNSTKTDSLKKEQKTAVETAISDILKNKTPTDTTSTDNSSTTEKVVKGVLGGLLGGKKKDSVKK